MSQRLCLVFEWQLGRSRNLISSAIGPPVRVIAWRERFADYPPGEREVVLGKLIEARRGHWAVA